MKLVFLKPLAKRFAQSRMGRRYLAFVLREGGGQAWMAPMLSSLEAPVAAVFWHSFLRSTFDRALKTPGRPEAIRGFEDLTWLFSSSFSNMAIALLNLDEAAYLYRLVKSIPACRGAEIGRYKGGSTFLLAAAMDGRSKLVSIDNHSDTVFNHRELDHSLAEALSRYGLRERVEIVVADSSGLEVEEESLDFLFIDGDHRPASVARDYAHWRKGLKPGGHLLFHDADNSRPFSIGTGCPLGAVEFMAEMKGKESPFFREAGRTGSLVHFVRTAVPFEAMEREKVGAETGI